MIVDTLNKRISNSTLGKAKAFIGDYFKPNEILGGDDGVADFPNDGDVAAVYLLSVLKCFSDFNPNWSQGAFPFHPEDYAYSADWGDLIELKLDGKLLIY